MARYRRSHVRERDKQGFSSGGTSSTRMSHASRSMLDPLALSYGTARGSSSILTSGSVTSLCRLKVSIHTAGKKKGIESQRVLVPLCVRVGVSGLESSKLQATTTRFTFSSLAWL